MALVQGATLSCAASVLPGVAGRVAGGGTHGATPTSDAQPDLQGVVTSINEAFSLPAVQWVVARRRGEHGPTPLAPGDDAGRGPRVPPPRRRAARQPGGAPGGSFTFEPAADLAPGPHAVRRAYAERLGVRGATSDPRAFTVGPLTPLELDVGCGCGTAAPTGSAVLGGAVLLLVRLRGRRRAS